VIICGKFPVKSRLLIGLILVILFGVGESFADHEKGTNQSISGNGTLPDFDDLETLPDLDDLSPIDDAPSDEINTPDQPSPIPDNNITKPDLSNSNDGDPSNLVLIIKGVVVKSLNDKLKIKMRSGYLPNIGDKVKYYSPHPNNSEKPVGSGVVVESGKEVWALISSGIPSLGMNAVITSTNPRKNTNYTPEKIPVAKVPSEPDVNASPEELFRVGERFFQGVDGPKDYEKAFKWVKLAAEKGHPEAQNNVGVMFQKGWGTKPDPQQAVYWYRKSAAGNFPMAHYNLGYAYDRGMGVRKNFSEAIKSYRRAAQLGNRRAQQRLRDQRLRW
jgi:hypothetical protein